MTLLAAGLAAAAGWLALAPGPLSPSAVRARGGWWALGVAAALGWLVTAGPVLALVPLVGWGAHSLLRVRARRREAAATAGRVLESCELLAAEATAGQPPERSLAAAAAAWPGLAPAAEAAALGGDVAQAMRELAGRRGAEEMRLVAAAWAVAHRSGGGLADALTRVAATIRADRAMRRVVDGELASARATARLVAALPLLVLLLGSGGDADAWRFLVGTPLGIGCLGGGLGLGLIGLWWIERIADGVNR